MARDRYPWAGRVRTQERRWREGPRDSIALPLELIQLACAIDVRAVAIVAYWVLYADDDGELSRLVHSARFAAVHGAVDAHIPIEDAEAIIHELDEAGVPEQIRALFAENCAVGDARSSIVYFVRAGVDGPVKIGWTRDLALREGAPKGLDHATRRASGGRCQPRGEG